MIWCVWKKRTVLKVLGIAKGQRQRLVLKTEGKVFHIMETHQLSFSKANEMLKKNIKHPSYKNAASILIIIILILL